MDTMPDIQFCLQGLCMEQPSLFSPFASPSIQATAQAQDHIGWVNLLLGQLAMEWVHFPAPPSVQHLLLPHCLFLGYQSDYPPPVHFS